MIEIVFYIGIALIAILVFNIIEAVYLFVVNCLDVYPIRGYRVFIHPHAIIARFLPRFPFFNIGEQYTMRFKRSMYLERKTDIVSIVSVIPPTRSFVVSDAAAIRRIAQDRQTFVKPMGIYQALALFGPNVGIVEGRDWLRHKKIVVASRFNETTTHTCWNETTRSVECCFEEWNQNTADTVLVKDLPSLILKISLYTIAGAGFSQHPPWHDNDSVSIPEGHVMSFRAAMSGVMENIYIKMSVPDWVYKIFPNEKLKHTRNCFIELEIYFQEMITTRRALGSEAIRGETGRQDLLGSLVAAGSKKSENDGENDASFPSNSLSDDEIMGNMYVFLLAGHDTTAHTVTFTFFYLALYRDVQEKLYKHIIEVCPLGQEMTYDSFQYLTYTLATFLETLRLKPSVVVIPKWCSEDTWVPSSGDQDEDEKDTGLKQVFIPRDSDIFLNAVGLHYNPRYWGENVNEFQPERFLYNKDKNTKLENANAIMEYAKKHEGFLGFSTGARSCLGQKFAQVEAVALISHFVREYEIVLNENEASNEESFMEKVERITYGSTVITLTPRHDIPVIFRRRRRRHHLF